MVHLGLDRFSNQKRNQYSWVSYYHTYNDKYYRVRNSIPFLRYPSHVSAIKVPNNIYNNRYQKGVNVWNCRLTQSCTNDSKVWKFDQWSNYHSGLVMQGWIP